MRLYFALVLLSSSTIAHADYLSDRQAAAKLMSAGKHTEALELFERMAEPPATNAQQADSLHQAALCAASLKQFDRALELAGRIPLPNSALACRLSILESDRRWNDMVAEFEPIDISTWPERLRGEAYLSRGTAHSVLKHGPKAARDFEAALNYLTNSNSLGYCSNLLGDVCRNLIKDDERALAAYHRTQRIGTIYKRAQAAIQAAEILVQQQKFDAALAEFDNIDLTELTVPFWRGKLLCAHGRVLAAAGHKTDAEAKFTEALAIPELPAEIRKECEAARGK